MWNGSDLCWLCLVAGRCSPCVGRDVVYEVRCLMHCILSRGTGIECCWVPSHCGLYWNEISDTLTKQVAIFFTVIQALKSYPFFWNISVVVGHSSSMWLSDTAFLQMHVTFCEYLVFREFKQSFHNYYSCWVIAGLFIFQTLYAQSFQVLRKSHKIKVVCECMIFQTRFLFKKNIAPCLVNVSDISFQ